MLRSPVPENKPQNRLEKNRQSARRKRHLIVDRHFSIVSFTLYTREKLAEFRWRKRKSDV
jgi:hypothetical protein